MNNRKNVEDSVEPKHLKCCGKSVRKRAAVQHQRTKTNVESNTKKTVKKQNTKDFGIDSKTRVSGESQTIRETVKNRISKKNDEAKRTKSSQRPHDKTNKNSTVKSKLCSRNSLKSSKFKKSVQKKKRVASLNALAKVHCLYENESKISHVDLDESSAALTQSVTSPMSPQSPGSPTSSKKEIVYNRPQRSLPGLRGAGRNWDMCDVLTSSTSSLDSLANETNKSSDKLKKKIVEKKIKKCTKTKPPSKKPELCLKDFVLKKRIASLNASAIMAATIGRKSTKSSTRSLLMTHSSSSSLSPHSTSSSSSSSSPPLSSLTITETSVLPIATESNSSIKNQISKQSICQKSRMVFADRKETKAVNKTVKIGSKIETESKTKPSKQVAVIVNHQDTDLTITGVYTSQSTGDGQSGYCSMQYRISAASETTTVISTPASTKTSVLDTQEGSSLGTIAEKKKKKTIDRVSLETRAAQKNDNTQMQLTATPFDYSEYDLMTHPIKCEKSYTPLSALGSMKLPKSSSKSSSLATVVAAAPATAAPVSNQSSPISSYTNRKHKLTSPQLPIKKHIHVPSQTSSIRVPVHSDKCYPKGYYNQIFSNECSPRPNFFATVGQSAFTVPQTISSSPAIRCYQPAGPMISMPEHMHSKIPPIVAASTQTATMSNVKSDACLANNGSSNEAAAAAAAAAAAYRYANSLSNSHPILPYQLHNYQHQYIQPFMPPQTPPIGLHPDLIYPQFQNNLMNRGHAGVSGGSGGFNTAGQSMAPPNFFNNYNSYAPNIVNQESHIMNHYPPIAFYGPQNHHYPITSSPYDHLNFPTSVHSTRNNYADLRSSNVNCQGCACPLQPCQKNLHTGPLIGDSSIEGSSKVPLPLAALALPLERRNVGNPPSPARGSAGIPPPPLLAGAFYQTNSSPPQLATKTLLTDVSATPKAATTNIMSENCLNNFKHQYANMCHESNKQHIPKHASTVNTTLHFSEQPLPPTLNTENSLALEFENPTVVKQEIHSPLEKEEHKSNWLSVSSLISSPNNTVPVLSAAPVSKNSQLNENVPMSASFPDRNDRSLKNQPENSVPLMVTKAEIDVIESSASLEKETGNDKNNNSQPNSPVQKLLLHTKKVHSSNKATNKSSYKNLIKKASLNIDLSAKCTAEKRKLDCLNDDENNQISVNCDKVDDSGCAEQDNDNKASSNKLKKESSSSDSINSTIDFVVQKYCQKSFFKDVSQLCKNSNASIDQTNVVYSPAIEKHVQKLLIKIPEKEDSNGKAPKYFTKIIDRESIKSDTNESVRKSLKKRKLSTVEETELGKQSQNSETATKSKKIKRNTLIKKRNLSAEIDCMPKNVTCTSLARLTSSVDNENNQTQTVTKKSTNQTSYMPVGDESNTEVKINVPTQIKTTNLLSKSIKNSTDSPLFNKEDKLVEDGAFDSRNSDDDSKEISANSINMTKSVMKRTKKKRKRLFTRKKVKNLNATKEPKSQESTTKLRKAKVRISKDSRDRATVSDDTAVSKIQKPVQSSPQWSNGWIWEGQAYEANVFLKCDDNTVIRKCYPAIRHLSSGDIIRPRDCVLLLSGPRSTHLPFVAKIASLWECPTNGEMMMSLLWYYRPDKRTHHKQELYASKHKDVSSVACIDDKCYVLTFNEYCRFHKTVKRIQEGIEHEPCIVPPLKHVNNQNQSEMPPVDINTDLVYFCHTVYDFRQKRAVKNPFLTTYLEKSS